MGELREYSIPFRGLKEGKHIFHFDIDYRFFDCFESSEIKEGDVLARVELMKHSQFLELKFFISGNVRVICDRCLEYFSLDIQHQSQLYIRFGEETYEQTEEILILADTVNEIRLEQFLYEYIHLALPYQRIHPEIKGHSGCNPEMTRRLKTHTPEDRSKVTDTDPRWDKLKDI